MGDRVTNAVIRFTRLGVNHTDHGILSFLIDLDYGGAGQGYGGICLDTVGADGRVATTLASELLLGIHAVFRKDWEELRGTSCRALINKGRIDAIGHFLEDKWLVYSQDDKMFVVRGLEAVKHLVKAA